MTHPCSERLHLLRKRRHLTQAGLGEALGVSQNLVSLWERGESLPDVAQLSQMCDFFGVSLDYLAGRSAHESGLDPDRWLVDLDEFERPTKGTLWAIKIPRRAKLVDYDELRRMESTVEQRKKGKG